MAAGKKGQFKNSKVHLIDHPVIDRDITILRSRSTSRPAFRAAISRVSTILAYHSLTNLPINHIGVTTPVAPTKGFEIAADIIVVPILRAGLSLVDGILHFFPHAKVGHLGMYRDEETKQPVDYYSNLPKGNPEDIYLVVDPMLATGGSACDAINFLKSKGIGNIRFVCLIAAPEGLERLNKEHPNVNVVTAAIDEKLNDDAFIVPGLGDAGDRYFGTE